MSKDSIVEEQFRKVVKNIKNRNAEIINEDYLYNYSYRDDPDYKDLYAVGDFIDDINLSNDEVIRQYKNYEYIYDINHGILSFGPREELDESDDLSHLPKDGAVEKKNVMSITNAINRLKNTYKLSDWQFEILDNSNNVHLFYIKKEIPQEINFSTQMQFYMVVANVYKNLKIVEKEIDDSGYYIARKVEWLIKGKPYIIILCEPYYQDSITEYIHKNINYLYHQTPYFNDDEIIKNGFVPKSQSPQFEYPPRVFFSVEHFNKDIYDKMMKSVVDSHKELPDYTNKYIEYTIAVRKIPDDIEFFADPKVTDCCYADKTIPYSCVIDKQIVEYN